jgi:prepilin-type N-terminal cleavage/methylation domain-containing protein
MSATLPFERGFTLAELAIVLLIVSLLLGGILVPLSAQIESRRVEQTQQLLNDIREALIGFSVTHGYLPCADVTIVPFGAPAGTVANDGQADVNAATGLCVSNEGNVPWSTLGLGDADGWGNRFHYRVTSGFASRSPAATFSLTTTGNLRICTTAACSTTLATQVPAVVLSLGRNGYGAISSTGVQLPNPPAANTDELANLDANNDFVSHARIGQGAGTVEFDDVVAWLSPNLLFSRMVSAGKLP